MTIPEIKESWSNYCTSLGNGLADIGNAVIDGGKAAWRYSRTQVKLATTAVKEVSRGNNVFYNITIAYDWSQK